MDMDPVGSPLPTPQATMLPTPQPTALPTPQPTALSTQSIPQPQPMAGLELAFLSRLHYLSAKIHRRWQHRTSMAPQLQPTTGRVGSLVEEPGGGPG